MVAGWLSLLFVMMIFVAVLFLAYVTTKFLGKKGASFLRGKNIHVIETISLGLDKHLHLIKVGERYVLLSSSGKNIQMLTALKSEEMGEVIFENQSINPNESFKEIFEKYVGSIGGGFQRLQKKKRMQEKNESSVEGIGSIRENLANIRAVNKRLKSNSKDAEDDNTYERSQKKQKNF